MRLELRPMKWDGTLSTTSKRGKCVTYQTQRLDNILTPHIYNLLLRLEMLGLVCVQTDSTLLEAQEGSIHRGQWFWHLKISLRGCAWIHHTCSWQSLRQGLIILSRTSVFTCNRWLRSLRCFGKTASWPMICTRVKNFVLERHWCQLVTFRHIKCRKNRFF